MENFRRMVPGKQYWQTAPPNSPGSRSPLTSNLEKGSSVKQSSKLDVSLGVSSNDHSYALGTLEKLKRIYLLARYKEQQSQEYMLCLAVVVHTCNSSTREAEVGGSLSSRPVWSTEKIPGQPWLPRKKPISKNQRKKRKQKICCVRGGLHHLNAENQRRH